VVLAAAAAANAMVLSFQHVVHTGIASFVAACRESERLVGLVSAAVVVIWPNCLTAETVAK